LTGPIRAAFSIIDLEGEFLRARGSIAGVFLVKLALPFHFSRDRIPAQAPPLA
jgi:hypothetical protein